MHGVGALVGEQEARRLADPGPDHHVVPMVFARLDARHADDDTASKSQAQKQFDDMLEAERQGGSDSGRGGKRGW